MIGQWTSARLAALDDRRRAQRRTEERTTALARLIRATGARLDRSRFRPVRGLRHRTPVGGLAWTRITPGRQVWRSRPYGAGFVRLALRGRSWAVERLPFDPRARAEPAGCFPTLALALRAVAPRTRHHFHEAP